mmetsp:Transcript_11204/g.28277  ORF Transcript_11204/g.28277 Transcript_11204/m.28277 type:complete len:247 (+) Transcript_11204:146-886(+)
MMWGVGASDRVRLEFLDAQACLRLQDCTRDELLKLPFNDQTGGARNTLLTVTYYTAERRAGRAEETEELDPELAREFYECSLVGKATCTGLLADYALPPTEAIAEAVYAVTSQWPNAGPGYPYRTLDRILTEAASADWFLTGINTQPTLKSVGEDRATALHCGKLLGGKVCGHPPALDVAFVADSPAPVGGYGLGCRPSTGGRQFSGSARDTPLVPRHARTERLANIPQSVAFDGRRAARPASLPK